MHCPFCNFEETKVIDSRLASEGQQIRRRRECLKCSERFTTFESAELVMPRIIKSDETRQPFDEQKLRSSMLKALEKRPVASEAIDAAVELHPGDGEPALFLGGDDLEWRTRALYLEPLPRELLQAGALERGEGFLQRHLLHRDRSRFRDCGAAVAAQALAALELRPQRLHQPVQQAPPRARIGAFDR